MAENLPGVASSLEVYGYTANMEHSVESICPFLKGVQAGWEIIFCPYRWIFRQWGLLLEERIWSQEKHILYFNSRSLWKGR